MKTKSIIFFVLVLAFCFQNGFGQKNAHRPTQTNKKTTLNSQKTDELFNKINELIKKGGEKFKLLTNESIKEAIKDFDFALQLLVKNEKVLGAEGKQIKAMVLFSLGMSYHQLSDPGKVIKILESSLPIYKDSDEISQFRAITYRILGENYQKINQPQKSVDNYLAAVECIKKLLEQQTVVSEIKSLKTDLATVYILATEPLLLTGLKSIALNYSNEAAKIFTEKGDLVGQANAINRIGRINLEMGNSPEAIADFQKSLQIILSKEVQQNPNDTIRELEAINYNNLGHAFNLVGDKKKAFEYFQTAIRLCEKYEINNPKPMIFSNLGIYHMEIGNFSEAIQNFQKAAQFAKKNGDNRTLAISLNNIGGALVELGNYTKAGEYWKQAIDISVEIGDFDTTASILTNSSVALLEIGEIDKAFELIQKAKYYFEVSDNRPNQAGIYTVLARIQRKKGNLDSSIENSKKALKISQEIGNKRLEAGLNLLLGTIYKEQNKFDEAGKFFFAALQSAQNIDDIVIEASSLLGLSNIQFEAKNYGVAILYGKKSVNLFQTVRGNIKNLDKETQSIFLENVSQAYQHLADLLINSGRIAEAEQVLALLKEEEFYEYVRRDDKVAKELTTKLLLTDEESAAFKRYNEFSENIAIIGKEFSALETEKRQLPPNQPFPKQAKFDELEKKLKDAAEVFLKFLDGLKEDFGESNALVTQVDSGLQGILKELNSKDTVIVSTIIAPDRLNLILTTNSFQKAYTVDTGSVELNKLVADFRKVVQNPAVDPRPVGKKLYDVLVKPLEKEFAGLNVKTIVWSLDGTLRYVPISALWDGKKYLAESYANAVITLASRDKLKDKPISQTDWKTAGFGVSKSATIDEIQDGITVKRKFDALSSVPNELCLVINDSETAQNCAEKGVINGKRYLDEQFTLEEFKNQLGRFPIIHIASHFSLKAGNDRNSYLLLGGGVERKLSIAELNRASSIFVGVELLTLSACNTAMTGEKKANGREIEGFGAVAQKQGAKSVLATLWAVADPSTRDLMREFYGFLSLEKLSKAESLRQAQLKLIFGNYKTDEFYNKRSDLAGEIPPDIEQLPFQKDSNRPFAHPYYWSPFVLIGNWQ